MFDVNLEVTRLEDNGTSLQVGKVSLGYTKLAHTAKAIAGEIEYKIMSREVQTLKSSKVRGSIIRLIDTFKYLHGDKAHYKVTITDEQGNIVYPATT